MKREIKFTTGSLDDFEVWVLRITEIIGIERGCGKVFVAKNGIKIQSIDGPGYAFNDKELFIRGKFAGLDTTNIVFEDKSYFDDAIAALNEFNAQADKVHSAHDVESVIREWLKDNGYDGLCNNDVETKCCCDFKVSPCRCRYTMVCQPAYRHECEHCVEKCVNERLGHDCFKPTKQEAVND